MTQNETNKISLTLKVVFALIVSFQTISANADQCPYGSNNVLSDTKAIAEKLALVYGDSAPKFQNAAYTPGSNNNLLDNKYHKIDRTLPFLNQFDGVGILTAQKFQNKLTNYNSAVMLSPCHVVSTAHGIGNVHSKMFFSVGQQTCNSADHFKNQNQVAEVVARGSEDTAANDWSILKTAAIAGIRSPKIYGYNLSKLNKTLLVGFPGKEIQENSNLGYKYSYGVFSKPTNVSPDGTVGLSDETDLPGYSGGGLFVLSKNSTGQPEAFLGGIRQGNKNVIQISSILHKIEQSNPVLFAEITLANETGVCN